MALGTGYFIALTIFIIWIVAITILEKKGILEKWGLSRIWGFALMWRTKKGRTLIDKMARPKGFWRVFLLAGMYVFYLGMAFMFIMLFISTVLVITTPFARPLGAEEVLVIPGINPYVPFIYGLIALIIAVVAHEFSHGIIARVEGFRVKNLGLLFAVIPIGAFMEPDEEEVSKGPRLKRIKMYVAGPLINFAMAVFFMILFSTVFIGSLSAEEDPFIITDMSKKSPLAIQLDDRPQAIFSVEGVDISTISDILEVEVPNPGEVVKIDMKLGTGERVILPTISGVVIWGVQDDTPADKANITSGSIIYSLDGVVIKNKDIFTEEMDEKGAGQDVRLVLLEPVKNEDDEIVKNRSLDLDATDIKGEFSRVPEYTMVSKNITLKDKYEVYPLARFEGKGYIGISSSYLGIINGKGSDEFLDRIGRPLSSADSLAEARDNMMYITFALPLELDLMPIHEPLTEIYQIDGPVSFLPDGVFWFLTNTIFYLFWINILLGLFNALPAVPLDGGFVFKDSIVLAGRSFLSGKHMERLEKISNIAIWITSLSVLFMILITIFLPWLKPTIF